MNIWYITHLSENKRAVDPKAVMHLLIRATHSMHTLHQMSNLACILPDSMHVTTEHLIGTTAQLGNRLN
jgi:hypothetical protein